MISLANPKYILQNYSFFPPTPGKCNVTDTGNCDSVILRKPVCETKYKVFFDISISCSGLLPCEKISSYFIHPAAAKRDYIIFRRSRNKSVPGTLHFFLLS